MTGRVDPIPQEARAFQGHRAGLVSRAIGAMIDIGIVAIALAAAYLAYWFFLFLIPPGGFETPTPALWFDLGLAGIATTLYLGISWHTEGRSVGCHVMGLRVLDRRGDPPNLVTA